MRVSADAFSSLFNRQSTQLARCRKPLFGGFSFVLKPPFRDRAQRQSITTLNERREQLIWIHFPSLLT